MSQYDTAPQRFIRRDVHRRYFAAAGLAAGCLGGRAAHRRPDVRRQRLAARAGALK